jgi:hypothetical protein
VNTGTILSIGGGFIALLGALFSLLMLRPLLGGQGFVGFSGLVVGIFFVAVGVALLSFGRRRARLEVENSERGFTEVATALARKHDGLVSIDQVAKATGLPTDEATGKMRALTGRGVFDLDFDANGQAVYKLSSTGGAASLARLSERS